MSKKDALLHYFNLVETGELNETKNTRAAYMAGYNYGVQVKMGRVRDKLRKRKPSVDDDSFSLALTRESTEKTLRVCKALVKVLREDFPASNEPMHMFAKEKHDATGAIRKHSGLPYIVHPEGVAQIVAAYGGSEDEINAAYAHDLIEDTGTTADEIEAKFGPTVAQIVSEITNDKGEINRLGKEVAMNQELVVLSNEALVVKLADMLYNMLDYPTEPQATRMIENTKYLLENRPEEFLEIHFEMIESIITAFEETGYGTADTDSYSYA